MVKESYDEASDLISAPQQNQAARSEKHKTIEAGEARHKLSGRFAIPD
jgi:hypothetical protein